VLTTSSVRGETTTNMIGLVLLCQHLTWVFWKVF